MLPFDKCNEYLAYEGSDYMQQNVVKFMTHLFFVMNSCERIRKYRQDKTHFFTQDYDCQPQNLPLIKQYRKLRSSESVLHTPCKTKGEDKTYYL